MLGSDPLLLGPAAPKTQVTLVLWDIWRVHKFLGEATDTAQLFLTCRKPALETSNLAHQAQRPGPHLPMLEP